MIAPADIRETVLKGEELSRNDTGTPLSKSARRKMHRYGHIPIVLRDDEDDIPATPRNYRRAQKRDAKRLIYKKPYHPYIQGRNGKH